MISGKLWNIIYEIKRQKIKRSNAKFVSSGNISPYMELNFENINYFYFDEKSINEIEVNPYYRYFDIFNKLVDVNSDGYLELKELLFNGICHYLAEIELKKGLTQEDYYLKFVEYEIKNGAFGEKLKTEIETLFSEREKKRLYKLIFNMYSNGNAMEHYTQAVSEIFKKSIIYNYQDTEEDLMLYIGHKDYMKKMMRY